VPHVTGLGVVPAPDDPLPPPVTPPGVVAVEFPPVPLPPLVVELEVVVDPPPLPPLVVELVVVVVEPFGFEVVVVLVEVVVPLGFVVGGAVVVVELELLAGTQTGTPLVTTRVPLQEPDCGGADDGGGSLHVLPVSVVEKFPLTGYSPDELGVLDWQPSDTPAPPGHGAGAKSPTVAEQELMQAATGKVGEPGAHAACVDGPMANPTPMLVIGPGPAVQVIVWQAPFTNC
jgi:hypothetical protein